MIATPDGRELCVELAGHPGGRAVIVHGGTPNSRHLFVRWIEDAERRGMLLACYDRPGYGDSTRHPGHRVADGAGDCAAVADALGIDRFAVWGLSGGGPYALACAALLPQRVVAAAVIGSVAPWEAPGLDYFDGMGEENVEDTKLLLSDPQAARRKVEEDRRMLLQTSAADVREAFETLVSKADAAVLAGPAGEHMHESMRAGLIPGADGWFDDGEAHLAAWGFDLASIRVPVKVWHGRDDRFVPFGHGEWLASHIPGAEAALSDTDGHLTAVSERIGEIHAWLDARF